MKIAIIGSGNMGGAIARGLSKSSFVKASDIVCTARSGETLDKLRQIEPEIGTTLDNRKAVKGADVVIVAVKPWLTEQVLNEISDELASESQILVSIAAGVTFEQLRSCLGSEIPVFRAIPNTAVEVLRGVTFISPDKASSTQVVLVRSLFSALGLVQIVGEEMMQAATALASCGTAFALNYIKASAEGGEALGFSRESALAVVMETVAGAVALLQAGKGSPSEEIRKVTTPGGMTEKGLLAMREGGFTESVISGLKACLK